MVVTYNLGINVAKDLWHTTGERKTTYGLIAAIFTVAYRPPNIER